jgi:acetyl-CoA carboxylase carboxyltransferase component
MFRRRPLMRAAVVGGGAYMAGKSVANRQAQQASMDADQDARISDLEQQQYQQQQPPQQYQQQPPPQYYQQQPAPQDYQQPPAQAPAASSTMIDQLNQLADLHQQGVLSDEEFAAAKAKLFSS